MSDMDEVHGTALAGYMTTIALIGRLKVKGVLSKSEVVEIFETTLSLLEAYPQADPAVMSARRSVEAMAEISARSQSHD